MPEPLERSTELQAGESGLARALAGDGCALAIAGPAGIGKTAILAALEEHARERGFRILRATGSELERELPFGATRQLFEPLLAGPAAERELVLAGPAERALPVLSPEASAGAEDGGEDSAFAVLHGLYWLTVNVAEQGPALILIDDAHWADRPTLRFLTYLRTRLAGSRILLAIAARDGYHSDEVPLREFIPADALRPQPLSTEGVASLLSDHLGTEVEPAFAAACHEATGGNPFLLQQLAISLAGDALAPLDENARLVAGLGPASVSRAVLVRLARMSPDRAALAKAVAVLGGKAELRDAAALAGLEVGEAAKAADELAHNGIFAPTRPIGFEHSIVRASIYGDIPPLERAELHAKAARALAARAADPALAGTHLLETEPLGDPGVASALREAARVSSAGGDSPAAIAFLDRALAEPPPEEERFDLLLQLGAASARAGEKRGTDLLRDAMRLGSEPGQLAAAARELAATLTYRGHATAAARVMIETLERLPPGSPLAPRLEANLLVSGVSTAQAHELARGHFEAAAERAEGLPEATAALLLAPLALERATCGGTAEEAATLARRALGEGRMLAALTADSPLPYVAAGALLWSGNAAEAERVMDAALADTRARASTRGYALASAGRALMRLGRGSLGGAEADALAALDTPAADEWPIFKMIATAVLAAVRVEQGELDDAASAIESLDAIARDPDAVLVQPLAASRYRLLMARGDAAEALATAERGRERERRWECESVTPFSWRSASAAAQLALGDAEAARETAAAELGLARSFGSSRAIGVAQRMLGLAAPEGERLELLREAEQSLAGSEDRLEHARALIDIGAEIRRGGSRTDARGPLREGLAMARACGASALAERAHTELEATGARPRKIIYAGVDALTASELRIAAMAASGLSNREIAQDLFVTVKTVEVHLSHVYAKLGIAGRRELPADLAGRGS